MIRINEIKLPLDAAAEQSLYPAAAKALKIDRKRIQSLEVVRKSIDSRKKGGGRFLRLFCRRIARPRRRGAACPPEGAARTALGALPV